MNYQQKAAAVDTFLAERNVDPEDVLSVSMSQHTDVGEDVRVHIYGKVDGVDYTPHEKHPRHHFSTVDVGGVRILLVFFDNGEEVAA